MNYIETEWNGYKCLEFEFKNRKAKLVCPKAPCVGNKWLLKTEYFGAFPAFELEMLADGYHVAYVANKTRWHDASDDVMKEAFCGTLSGCTCFESVELSGRSRDCRRQYV